MTHDKIKTVSNLAREFIERAAELEAEEARREGYPAPRQRGALRRISMELTGAVADLRKPD